jgi:PAS domain S-box-containing protein
MFSLVQRPRNGANPTQAIEAVDMMCPSCPQQPDTQGSAGMPHSKLPAMEHATPTEKALRLSEQRFINLFRNSPAAIGISTVHDGRLIDVNERYCDLVGFSRVELLGRTVRELRLHVDGHDRDAVMQRLLQDGRITGLETRFRRKDGELRDIMVNLEMLELAGEAEPVMVAQIVDITERKAAEQRLIQSQALLKMASRMSRLGAWQVELPSLEVRWSDEVREILGVSADFRPSVEVSLEFYHADHRALIGEAVRRCGAEGVPFDVEARIQRKDGNEVWVRVLGEAVRDDVGRIVRVQGTFQDITRRRKDEEHLRLLENCISRLSDIVVITEAEPVTDLGPRIVYVNDAFERRTGYSREEVLGKAPRILQGPKTQRQALDRIRTALEGWSPIREELINYTKSGEEFWLELDIVPVADPTGFYTHWVAIQRDITGRKRSEEALRVSEERFRLLAKVSNDVIWDWDLGSGQIWWNEGLPTLLGGRPQGVENVSGRWNDIVHPEDRETVATSLRKAMEGSGDEWQAGYRILRLDGGILHVVDRGHIIRDTEGRPVRMVGGMTDVTERRRSEERLAEQAALIDQTRDAIVVRDLQGVVRFWNKGAERIHGRRAVDAVGHDIRELVAFDRDQFDAAVGAVVADGVWNGELNAVSADGKDIRLDSRWTLLRDAQGTARSILAVDTDVTERKRLESQFLRAQRMESIGTLAGGIAHDLNNVLAPILMSIELLRLEMEAQERSEILDIIRSAAQRGSDMVRQVLSFARGVEGQRVVVELKHLIRDLSKIVSETFPRNIELRTETSPALRPVLGDPTQIHQVLLNLCVNARDAMPNGGILTVESSNFTVDDQFASLVPDARCGDYVRIEVGDTGTGIPPANLEKIFDPFFTTKEHGKGTGLGLSTSLAIVRSHGGFIRVQSEPGRGSRFAVHIPATELTSRRPESGTDQIPRGHGERILLVEDEPAVRAVTRQTLEQFGYKVLVASDGAEAVSVFAQNTGKIDMVFTDMMMPVMDGLATIHVLRRMDPQVRILAASGLSLDESAAKEASSGIRHFLPKPYSADVLLSAVAKVLKGSGEIRDPSPGGR